MARGNRDDILEEDKKRKVNKAGIKSFLEIFRFVRPYKGYLIVGLISLALSALATLGFPLLAGKLVDAADNKAGGYSINQVTIALMGILLLNAIFAFLRIRTFANVSEKSLRDIRVALYDKLVHLSIPFFEERRVGELTSRITSDVQQLQDVLSFTLAEFLRQAITLVVGILLLLVFYPKLTLFMLATFPIIVIGAIIFGRYIRKLSKKTQDSLAYANTIVMETLQGVHTVKAYTNEMYETTRYSNALAKVIQNALNGAKYRGLLVSFIIFVVLGGIVGVIWYAATLYSQRIITAGDLISFTLFTGFVGASVAGLGEIYSQLQKTIGASERIRELLAQENEQTTFPEKETLKQVGDIVFSNVHFSYPTRPDIEVLKGITIQIRNGQKIALVGHSGSGKSTITSLLLRYYQPSTGNISVSGIDIEAIELKELRKHIGIVPQDVLLFGGSIAENISYGKPLATLDEIKDAARKANALEFIEKFPEGFNTVVGERGVKLSGGQRQRIAIARAILKDPEILILDEATSSLDAESERLVQEALDELMKDRTTIIIAHRLATIRKVDYIYVIGDGHIQEQGTHDDLSEMENGIYSNLLRLQFEIS
ncbi:ABC transporter transmembrane domain-containing protein [Cytophagaceae bacterium DM2B3-1]|uniref:ABC transporter transmembrane domain-containing protein n=1 Tax=Xanthocytophaga flava TaxID=3048013 RepID=A0ABT7CPG7_9BACT|nr:ABC transporter transmembrane domain-containing protein [Xanthocytophaga flavus]MDJ1468772.1 ABC transporter transmembrane domain-containing protein [Xanthocytophaga flavus]MDJ1495632.1 ABC transporter transmembrane domain-containing protein [Xanthocytophaga flavus]